VRLGLALLLLFASCTRAAELSPGLVNDDVTQSAFSEPMPLLTSTDRASFFVGNSFFNQNWVSAPSSLHARDGLGPLFNARSCSACHLHDGRAALPDAGEELRTTLLRISIPGKGPHGAPLIEPTYGDQIQTSALPAVPREAAVRVTYELVRGSFADGERYTLRRPRYTLSELGYGPPVAALQTSARIAPQLVGLGLLDAVGERELRALADPDDADQDGISGRTNWVWSPAARKLVRGRFGWKAEQASVREQVVTAFADDMGITSTLIPSADETVAQPAARAQPSGGEPELDDETLERIVLYVRTLALPAARAKGVTERRGERLFEQAGCTRCHHPSLTTNDNAEPAILRSQTFYPYTDLLLHDLGELLDDGRPTFSATGREWRTAPLFGLGLVERVNANASYLHDGRARTLGEAILFHGGEASSARAAFVAFNREERAALIAFVKVL
jgi:CxxC motif-containing protein (DUF1111 family)